MHNVAARTMTGQLRRLRYGRQCGRAVSCGDHWPTPLRQRRAQGGPGSHHRLMADGPAHRGGSAARVRNTAAFRRRRRQTAPWAGPHTAYQPTMLHAASNTAIRQRPSPHHHTAASSITAAATAATTATAAASNARVSGGWRARSGHCSDGGRANKGGGLAGSRRSCRSCHHGCVRGAGAGTATSTTTAASQRLTQDMRLGRSIGLLQVLHILRQLLCLPSLSRQLAGQRLGVRLSPRQIALHTPPPPGHTGAVDQSKSATMHRRRDSAHRAQAPPLTFS